MCVLLLWVGNSDYMWGVIVVLLGVVDVPNLI